MVIGKLPRESVSGKEIAPDSNRRSFFHTVYDTKHLQFAPGRKSVAAFNLYCARTTFHAPHKPLHSHFVQIVLRCTAQQVGRIENPASAPCNFHIRQSADLILIFLLAAAGIDNMGMRISKCRKHELP